MAIVSLFFITPVSFADTIQWHDYKTGSEISKKTNKKLYIYFYSNTCPWCVKMEKDTLADKDIAKYLNKNYVPVKVDVSKDMATARLYKIGPIPANIFVEPDVKTLIYNRPGYVHAQTFYSILEAIKNEKYKK
jgi:thioredoxin-related protein